MTLREHELADSPPLTPAGHRAQAEKNLMVLRGLSAGSPAHSALALSAIAHLLAAIAAYIDPDEVPAPEMRLPGRITVRARQSLAGNHQWAWVLVPPDNGPVRVSRYRYLSATAALAAGAEAAGNEYGRETGDDDD